MQSIALVSGLIGATASAAFSFLVRFVLDRRSQNDAERRIAFVYLIKVSNVVAADLTIKAAVKKMVPPEALKELTNSNSGQFDAAHKLSAMLADGLQKISAEEIKSNQGFRAFPRFVASQLDTAKDVKLTSEQLSKLPRDVVYSCAKFQTLLTHALQVVEMWGELFENDERYWVTAEGIHDQWMAILRFVKAAQELRLALIKFGAATPEEADQLLSKQVESGLDVMQNKTADKPKLDAALAAYRAASKAQGDPVI